MNTVKNLHKLQLPKKWSKIGNPPGTISKGLPSQDKEMKNGIKTGITSDYVSRVDCLRLPPSDLDPAGGLVVTRELVLKTEHKKVCLSHN